MHFIQVLDEWKSEKRALRYRHQLQGRLETAHRAGQKDAVRAYASDFFMMGAFVGVKWKTRRKQAA